MKILYVTTVGSTMGFFVNFIDQLIADGHTVDIAANDSVKKVPEFYKNRGCRIFSLDFSRSPLSLDNLMAFGQLDKIIRNGNYDIVHCHTPNASVITRLVCQKYRKKTGLKVFYTAHGFHFYKGAPRLNWIVYYPVEKFCSYFTDKLITINKEDYGLAKKKFKAKEIHYVPGVGIDLSKFENVNVDRAAKRREIGVPEDTTLLLSVGELNENKNHQVVLRALAKLNDSGVHYAIAGVGDKREYLLDLAKELGISDRVHLLDFRRDVPELNHVADIFCFPSMREGLGMASIEAMSCGLPLVTSNVHGINDYSENDVTGYKTAPTDADGFANAIKKLKEDSQLSKEIGQHNKKLSKKYSVENIIPLMRDIYGI